MKVSTDFEQSKRLIKAGVPKSKSDMRFSSYEYDIATGETKWFGTVACSVYPDSHYPSFSLSVLWDIVHDMDKTYEFSTRMSSDELIEVLVKTIEFRYNYDGKDMDED